MIQTSSVLGGTILDGRYRLDQRIGRGGMGEVWRGRHTSLGTDFAVKLLTSNSLTEGQRQRFLREAQVAASLRTRHAVTVFDFGVAEAGTPYLVMELCTGETLQARIAREGSIDARTTAQILRQVSHALERSHAAGVVHCDLKPDNIMLETDERGELMVKVLDFGIAKLARSLDGRSQDDEDLDEESRPSISRNAGTPYYMAPEQIAFPDRVTPAADVWAFGVLAYECLTGRRPFLGERPAEVFIAVTRRILVPASVHKGHLSELFDDWFELACARDPGQRLPDVGTAAATLEVVLNQDLDKSNCATDPAPAARYSAAPTPPTESVDEARSLTLRSPSKTRARAKLLGGVGLFAALTLLAFGALSRRPSPTPSVPAPVAETGVPKATTQLTAATKPELAGAGSSALPPTALAVTEVMPENPELTTPKTRAPVLERANRRPAPAPSVAAIEATEPRPAPVAATDSGPKPSPKGASPFTLPELGF